MSWSKDQISVLLIAANFRRNCNLLIKYKRCLSIYIFYTFFLNHLHVGVTMQLSHHGCYLRDD